jgi:hypothetical protein
MQRVFSVTSFAVYRSILINTLVSDSRNPFMSIILQSYLRRLDNFKSFKSLEVTTCFGQFGHHQVLKYI